MIQRLAATVGLLFFAVYATKSLPYLGWNDALLSPIQHLGDVSIGVFRGGRPPPPIEFFLLRLSIA